MSGNSFRDAKDAAQAFNELAKTVGADDVAEEAAGPLGKVVGTSLELVYIPLRLLRHGAEKVARWLAPELDLRLKAVPKEKVISVDPLIGAPAVEGLLLAFDHDELKEGFANLLATAANSDTAHGVLPSFPSILRQLSSDEARILKWMHRSGKPIPVIHVSRRESIKELERPSGTVVTNLSTIGMSAGCSHPEMVPAYLDNLASRELFTDINASDFGGDKEHFEGFSRLTAFTKAVNEIDPSGRMVNFERRLLYLSDLGRAFCDACMGLPPVP